MEYHAYMKEWQLPSGGVVPRMGVFIDKRPRRARAGAARKRAAPKPRRRDTAPSTTRERGV